jgi:hypothetical protein
MFAVSAHIPHKISKEKVIHTIQSYQWGNLVHVGYCYFQDGMNLWMLYFDSSTPEGKRIHLQLKAAGIMKYQKVNDWYFSHTATLREPNPYL